MGKLRIRTLSNLNKTTRPVCMDPILDLEKLQSSLTGGPVAKGRVVMVWSLSDV